MIYILPIQIRCLSQESQGKLLVAQAISRNSEFLKNQRLVFSHDIHVLMSKTRELRIYKIDKLTLSVLCSLQKRKVTAPSATAHIFILVLARTWNLYVFSAWRVVIEGIVNLLNLLSRC